MKNIEIKDISAGLLMHRKKGMQHGFVIYFDIKNKFYLYYYKEETLKIEKDKDDDPFFDIDETFKLL